MKISLLLALLFLSNFALACRCAEQPLAAYFANADEVFIGTLLQTQSLNEDERQFMFERHGLPYKRQSGSKSQLPYVSNKSTAACAVAVQPGAVYIVFAERDESAGHAVITSCNGTRIHRTSQGDQFGFTDVAAKFVVSQLTGLAGLEALRRIASVEVDAADVDNADIIGLLDVAALTHTAAVPVYAVPRQTDADAVMISSYDDLQHRESGYEVDAALVYAEVAGWYKVQLRDGGFGWLAPDAAGTFWPLETLLINRLTYFVQDWNRFVWPEIGAGIARRLSYPSERPPREQAVKIISSQYIAQSLWFEVEVLQHNACEGKPEKVLARGWVPAYTELGEPVAWFYSRGC